MARKTQYRLEAVIVLRDRLTNTAKRVTRTLERFKMTASSVSGAFSKMANTMRLVFAGAVGTATASIYKFLSSGVKFRAELEQMEIALSNFAGGQEQARKELQEIARLAAKTPFEFRKLANAFVQLRSAGFSAEEAKQKLLELGNVLAGVGNIQALDNVIYNFIQIKRLGEASATDIKQFGMALIPIQEYLAKAKGISVQQLEGTKITYEDVARAFELMTKKGEPFFNAMEKQSKTLSARWETFRESLILTASEVVEQTGLLEALGNILEKIAGWFEANKDQIVSTFANWRDRVSELWQRLEPLFEWIQKNKNELILFGKIVLGVSAAFGALGVALLVVNSALLPVTLGILGISLAIYGVIKAWEWFKKKWENDWKWKLKDWKTYLGLIKNALLLLLGPFGAILRLGTHVWNVMNEKIQGVIDKVKNLIGKFEQLKSRINFGSRIRGVWEGLKEKIFKRQTGGLASGWTLVGERGPELVRLPPGSRVVDSERTQKMVKADRNITIVVNGDLGTREAVRRIFFEEVIPMLKTLNYGTNISLDLLKYD